MSLIIRLRAAFTLVLLTCPVMSAAAVAHPIGPSDLISSSELNGKLLAVKAGKVVLIQVGFHTMYMMGHIPGSQYAGAASNPQGLAALKKLVANLPCDREIVIYCGCCPWDDCPNVRPAFDAIREMGFTNCKVLDIPDRLGTDWTEKGYPIVKGD